MGGQACVVYYYCVVPEGSDGGQTSVELSGALYRVICRALKPCPVQNVQAVQLLRFVQIVNRKSRSKKLSALILKSSFFRTQAASTNSTFGPGAQTRSDRRSKLSLEQSCSVLR